MEELKPMPRADCRSLSLSAGRTNNQPCQKTKGNAAMNPAMADTKMWVVKLPSMVVLISS